jgi:hypothetical protein
MVLVDWSIDWLFFVEINLFLELKVFEKKKWRLYWLRKKQVLRIMDWLNLNDTNNHKSNIVVVIVCWWCLFCFENRGRFDVVAFVFLKEERSSIPMQLFYRGFHIDWVFWVNTTCIFLVMAFHYLLVLVFLFKLIIKCLISIMSGK